MSLLISSSSDQALANPVGFATLGELFGVPAAAWSVSRRVNPDYMGPLAELVRESDEAVFMLEQDAGGLADIAALEAFVAAGDARVKTVYSQVDGVPDFITHTNSLLNYPRIVIGGVAQTVNGRLRFVADSNDRLKIPNATAKANEIIGGKSRITASVVGVGEGVLLMFPGSSQSTAWLNLSNNDGSSVYGRRTISGGGSTGISTGNTYAGLDTVCSVYDGDYVENHHEISINRDLAIDTDGVMDSAGLTSTANASGDILWAGDSSAGFTGSASEIVLWFDQDESFDVERLRLATARFFGVA